MATKAAHLRGPNTGPVTNGVVFDVEGAGPPANSLPRKEGVSVQSWHCQVALAVTQTLFVIGSVYLKRSLLFVDADIASFHPIIYAFIREAVAGPILCTLALGTSGRFIPKQPDLSKVLLLGCCLYFNQLLYIEGISLSGVVVATCMQPTVPVFTALLAVVLRTESGSLQKFVGIGLAVGGSICMVLGGISTSASHSAAVGGDLLLGNFCLLGNTLSTSIYYLTAKQLVAKYSPLVVTSWGYLIAAVLMGATAVLTIDQDHWVIPQQLFGALVYWIVVCSVLGYFVVTWATQHLPASQVAAFQCFQPFVGTVLAVLVLGEQPTWWDLGALGVIAGLVLVATDKADAYVGPMMSKVKRMLSSHNLYKSEKA